MYQLINDTSARHLPSGTVFPLPPVESYGHDYQRWLDAGNVPEPAEVVVPSEEEVLAGYIAALDAHMDAQAQTRRYDNRVTCSLRAGYPGPFQAEGLAFATWMDSCNALGYQVLAEVQAGQRPTPTIEEFIQMLPALVWPE